MPRPQPRPQPTRPRRIAAELEPTKADFDEVRDRIARARQLGGTAVGDIIEGVGRELHGLVEGPVAVVRPVRQGEGFALDFASVLGVPPGSLESWSSIIRRTPRGAFLYDPSRPAPDQRNVLHEMAMNDPHAAQAAMTALRAMGIGSSTQLRMLLCDGPLLLATVSGYFHPGRPVTNRDRARLRRFGLGVKPILRLVASVQNNLAADALDAMMEAYPGEAYLVHADGRIACANELGARVLDERAEEAQLAILRAVCGAPDSPFDVHPVRRTGMVPMSLLTRASRHDTSLEARIAHAAHEWTLSPREVEVLRALANGSANKEIAARGGISLRTVEVHVTSLLRKARLESRLELVVRLWRGH